MIAVYRWGTRDLLLVSTRAVARELLPGPWYGRYVEVPVEAGTESISRALARLSPCYPVAGAESP